MSVPTPPVLGVVSHAGAMLLVDAIRTAGIDRALSVTLEPWRKPTAVGEPAKILLDVAVSLAVGGDCLTDVAVLRGARSCSAALLPTRRCRD